MNKTENKKINVAFDTGVQSTNVAFDTGVQSTNTNVAFDTGVQSTNVAFDASVWGPQYWFFLHTIAFSYPKYPTSVTKRKYYDLIQNFPLFIPNDEISARFANYLDKYPVTPYLDNRDSFVRWIFFIHNKFNQYLGKEEISIIRGTEYYWNQYRPKTIIIGEKFMFDKKIMIMLILFFLVLAIYFLY
jgi:hypothetical protein